MASARTCLHSLRPLLVLLIASLSLQAAAPRGWFLAGNTPASYDTGVDGQASYNGHPSAYLKFKDLRIDGFGTLMQSSFAPTTTSASVFPSART